MSPRLKIGRGIAQAKLLRQRQRVPIGSAVVFVAVKIRGWSNLARAGKGKLAKTASSTNSGFYAARAAAAKYFACKETAINLTQLSREQFAESYVASKGGAA